MEQSEEMRAKKGGKGQADRQTDRQINRQTDTQTNRQTNTEKATGQKRQFFRPPLSARAQTEAVFFRQALGDDTYVPKKSF
jgi:hypothetical protein